MLCGFLLCHISAASVGRLRFIFHFSMPYSFHNKLLLVFSVNVKVSWETRLSLLAVQSTCTTYTNVLMVTRLSPGMYVVFVLLVPLLRYVFTTTRLPLWHYYAVGITCNTWGRVSLHLILQQSSCG